jgi:hypothetical protein
VANGNPFALRNSPFARHETTRENERGWWGPRFRLRNARKKHRRRNTDRRNFSILPCLRDTAAPGAPGAHLSAFHRGSRPKESFIARDSAPGFCFLGPGGQGWPVRRAGVTRPYLSQSSEQTRPSRSAEGLMPNAARERVAKSGLCRFAKSLMLTCFPS